MLFNLSVGGRTLIMCLYQVPDELIRRPGVSFRLMLKQHGVFRNVVRQLSSPTQFAGLEVQTLDSKLVDAADHWEQNDLNCPLHVHRPRCRWSCCERVPQSNIADLHCWISKWSSPLYILWISSTEGHWMVSTEWYPPDEIHQMASTRCSSR